MSIAGLRFMVVEDHGFQRWVLANVLEKMGVQHVLAASNGRTALELLGVAGTQVDVIITDLDMPGMDGMEFIRNLGQSRSNVSLIVVSSLERSVVESVQSMARAYGVTVLGTIQKPASEEKLLELVVRHRGLARPVGAPPAAFGEAEVREALRRGQIEAFFQPKVELFTRKLVGAEALARWRHAEKGVLPPLAFLGSFASAGLTDELTAAIVRSAARNCRVWRGAGVHIPVSVNLSVESLADVTLAERMVNHVVGQKMAPGDLILEVQESACAGADVGVVLENLTRLRMKGFGLSVDDFGTGSVSMERLSQWPVTELKVDHAFVHDAWTRPSRRAVLETSLEFARKLGVAAVAEGVENRWQWDLLRELGCPLAQGYFIAQPMEAGEFHDWARLRHQASS